MKVRSGRVSADGDAVERVEEPVVDPADRALIDAGGIEEAVARAPIRRGQAPGG